jgi:hypothetical protein
VSASKSVLRVTTRGVRTGRERGPVLYDRKDKTSSERQKWRQVEEATAVACKPLIDTVIVHRVREREHKTSHWELHYITK